MSAKVIAVAADHAGFALKELIKLDLQQRGDRVLDLGTNGNHAVDYPDFGLAAAQTVAQGQAEIAVIVCASGIGMSIAANRLPEVRAALCHTVDSARMAREHNDANVLALGARTTDPETAKAIVDAFLSTPFSGGRHIRRVEKLGKINSNNSV
jgi:ribose 5-phosphate isomerase B